jgi:hypothetical protein
MKKSFEYYALIAEMQATREDLEELEVNLRLERRRTRRTIKRSRKILKLALAA